jgi:hypothetical protein
MTVLASPVARETMLIPPLPIARASAAAQILPVLSSICSCNARYFSLIDIDFHVIKYI